MKKLIQMFIFSHLLIICSSASAATQPICTVTFEKEPPLTAVVVKPKDRSKILVAESKRWLQRSGARIEIEYLVSDGKLSPVLVYIHELRGAEMLSAVGNTVQMPIVEPLRRQYWFDPIEGLHIKGTSDENVAFVKCNKRF